MKNNLLFILSILLICSCGQRTTLNEADLEWQPYKIGDSLKFKSNKNETFVLVIDDINRYHSVTDPLDIIPDRTEHCAVFGKYSLIKPWISSIGDSVFHERTKLLHLNSGLGKSDLQMRLVIEDSWFYGDSGFDIIDLDKMEKTQFSELNDILIIRDTIGKYIERDNHIERFFWSKKFGYVRYELKDGYFWELQSFRRNGENILTKN